MRVQWDQILEMWAADAEPAASGRDAAVGPAGPAGVVVLRSPSATVSQCTITGRVTSLWFEGELGDADRQLLGLFLPAGTELPADGPGDPASFPVLPVAERVDAARLALLLDAQPWLDRGPVSPARLLLHAELAEVCRSVASRAPALVPPEEAARHAALADRLAAEGGWRSLTDGLPDGVRFDPLPTEAVLERLAHVLGELGRPGDPGPAAGLLAATAERLRAQPLSAGPLGPAEDAPEPPLPNFRGHRGSSAAVPEPVTIPELFARPDLAVIDNPAPEGGDVRLEAEIGPDGRFSLGDLAPRQVGLAAEGGVVALNDRWCTVTVALDPTAPHPMAWWAIAEQAGEPIGAGPFTHVDGDAEARFAVTHGDPDHLVVAHHPLQATATSKLAQLEAADRLGRAAWWALRAGDARAPAWLAHLAVAWFELGRVLRAGWAFALAGDEGRAEVAGLLERRADDEGQQVARAAMRAVAVAGLVPDAATVGVVPTPAWVLATDLLRYAGSLPDGN